MVFHPELLEIGRRAKQAARQLAFDSTESKNNALLAMAEALIKNEQEILKCQIDNGVLPLFGHAVRMLADRQVLEKRAIIYS